MSTPEIRGGSCWNLIRSKAIPSDEQAQPPYTAVLAAAASRSAADSASERSTSSDPLKRKTGGKPSRVRRGMDRVGPILAVVVLIAVFLSSPHSLGQETFRNLTGTITDQQREPLQGAVIEVHSADEHTVVSYITDRTGHYSFKRLSGDLDYEIWCTYRGRRSPTKKLSHFDMKTEKVIDLSIKLD